jgi:hypothetical protein
LQRFANRTGIANLVNFVIALSDAMKNRAVTLKGASIIIATCVNVVLFAQATPRIAQDEITPHLRPMQKGHLWGYVSPAGTFVVPPQFDSAGEFSEGLASVELRHRFGYINEDGEIVIKAKYYAARPFKEGRAWVITKKPFTILGGTGEYGAALNGKVTFIDREGREIVPAFTAEFAADFSEGRAVVRPGEIVGGCSGKVGFIDQEGKWIRKPEFDDARDFREGLAAVNLGAKCHMGGKWGFIGRDGRELIPLRYSYARGFINGRACVALDNEWELIDSRGQGTKVSKDVCLQ